MSPALGFDRSAVTATASSCDRTDPDKGRASDWFLTHTFETCSRLFSHEHPTVNLFNSTTHKYFYTLFLFKY